MSSMSRTIFLAYLAKNEHFPCYAKLRKCFFFNTRDNSQFSTSKEIPMPALKTDQRLDRVICTCENCSFRYEARANESKNRCVSCRPSSAYCIHLVSSLDHCVKCEAMHGKGSTMRSMLIPKKIKKPAAPKKAGSRKTYPVAI